VGRGMEYLASHGLVHGNLKSANVAFVEDQGGRCVFPIRAMSMFSRACSCACVRWYEGVLVLTNLAWLENNHSCTAIMIKISSRSKACTQVRYAASSHMHVRAIYWCRGTLWSERMQCTWRLNLKPFTTLMWMSACYVCRCRERLVCLHTCLFFAPTDEPMYLLGL
jgi:hypothetical protein